VTFGMFHIVHAEY